MSFVEPIVRVQSRGQGHRHGLDAYEMSLSRGLYPAARLEAHAHSVAATGTAHLGSYFNIRATEPPFGMGQQRCSYRDSCFTQPFQRWHCTEILVSWWGRHGDWKSCMVQYLG